MAGYDWGKESYTEGGGGDFIGEAEFNKLLFLEKNVLITNVGDGVSTYNEKEKPQFLVSFFVDDDSPDAVEQLKGFDKGNAERNARIERIRATLEATGEPVEAAFCKVGRRNDIRGPYPSE